MDLKSEIQKRMGPPGRHSASDHLVAAAVLVVAAVKRLMDVGDQVDEEAECLRPGADWGTPIGQDGTHALDGGDDAVAMGGRMAIPGHDIARRLPRDVDEVPSDGVPALRPNLVSPHEDRDGGVVGPQQRGDACGRLWAQPGPFRRPPRDPADVVPVAGSRRSNRPMTAGSLTDVLCLT